MRSKKGGELKDGLIVTLVPRLATAGGEVKGGGPEIDVGGANVGGRIGGGH
jgi:hypothetical protein